VPLQLCLQKHTFTLIFLLLSPKISIFCFWSDFPGNIIPSDRGVTSCGGSTSTTSPSTRAAAAVLYLASGHRLHIFSPDPMLSALPAHMAIIITCQTLAPACVERSNTGTPLHIRNIINIDYRGTWRQKTTAGSRCGEGR